MHMDPFQKVVKKEEGAGEEEDSKKFIKDFYFWVDGLAGTKTESCLEHLEKAGEMQASCV